MFERTFLAAFCASILSATPTISQTDAAEVTWPSKMCSNGFDRPAFMIDTDEGYELHIGSRVERLTYGGSVGTGINGAQLALDGSDELEVMLTTEILMDTNNSPPTVAYVRILRDRVFWPCDFFGDGHFLK